MFPYLDINQHPLAYQPSAVPPDNQCIITQNFSIKIHYNCKQRSSLFIYCLCLKHRDNLHQRPDHLPHSLNPGKENTFRIPKIWQPCIRDGATSFHHPSCIIQIAGKLLTNGCNSPVIRHLAVVLMGLSSKLS